MGDGEGGRAVSSVAGCGGQAGADRGRTLEGGHRRAGLEGGTEVWKHPREGFQREGEPAALAGALENPELEILTRELLFDSSLRLLQSARLVGNEPSPTIK